MCLTSIRGRGVWLIPFVFCWFYGTEYSVQTRNKSLNKSLRIRVTFMYVLKSINICRAIRYILCHDFNSNELFKTFSLLEIQMICVFLIYSKKYNFIWICISLNFLSDFLEKSYFFRCRPSFKHWILPVLWFY